MSDRAIINQSTLDSIGSLLVRNNIAHSPVTPMGMVEVLAAMHPLPQYPHPWVMKDAVTLSDDTHLWYYFEDDASAYAYFSAQFTNHVSGVGFFTVDWGDGTTEQIAVTATLANRTLSHRYLLGGEHHVVISGYDAIKLANNTFSSNTYRTDSMLGGLAIRQAQFGHTYDKIAFVANCMGFGLRYVAFQYGATSIGNDAFSSSPSLREIDLSACTSIGNNALEGCSSLTSVGDMPALTSIGGFAFSGCASLASVGDMPALTSIGQFAFQNCSSLASVGDMPALTTAVASFRFCSALKSVGDMPLCESFGSFMFDGCTALETIGDISSCREFGYACFGGCTSLRLVKFLSRTAAEVETITGFAGLPARQTCIVRCADGDFYRSGNSLVPLT